MIQRSVVSVAAILAVVAVVMVPSLAGMRGAPPGGVWTGILTRNTADVNGYLSMIEEVRQGSWRTRNLFTAEPHPPFQLRPFYATLGIVGRFLPSISTVTLMELGRIVTVSALVILLMILAGRLFTDPRERLICFLILIFGSGAGWLYWVPDSPDLRYAEYSTFIALLSPPLYSLSLFLIVGILLCMERGSVRPAVSVAVTAGLLGLWLGLDRPFSLALLGFAALGLLIVDGIRTRRPFTVLAKLLPLALGAGCALLYQFVFLSRLPVYQEWNRQHFLLTPEWPQFINAFGFLIPLAVLGIAPLFRANLALATCLISYAFGSVLLSHLPFQFQERFAEGLPLCLAAFAAAGLIHGLGMIHRIRLRTAVTAATLLFLAPSCFIAWRTDLEAIARQSPPQYLPERAVEGMRQLAVLAGPEEAILSSESSGNFIAAYAARPVVIGHKVQTANYLQKRAAVESIFRTSAASPGQLEKIQRTGASWLFWGPEEAWLASGAFLPEQAPFLKLEYNNGFIRLYRVSP